MGPEIGETCPQSPSTWGETLLCAGGLVQIIFSDQSQSWMGLHRWHLVEPGFSILVFPC